MSWPQIRRQRRNGLIPRQLNPYRYRVARVVLTHIAIVFLEPPVWPEGLHVISIDLLVPVHHPWIYSNDRL